MAQDSPSAGAMLRAVLHPTDFSPESDLAFAHALKIALASKAHLDIVHAEPREPDTVDWTAFPGVRDTLTKWGLLEPGSPPSAVAERVGARIRKVDIVDPDPVRGIAEFAGKHPVDLLVLATYGREGLSRWRHGPVAEPVARRAHAPTLFLPQGAQGFVDPETGDVLLRRVLVPIDHDPRPGPVVEWAYNLAKILGVADHVQLHLLHVGAADEAPAVDPPTGMAGRVEIHIRGGDVVETIMDTAAELGAGLIAMATQGHHGFLDALRGSTTEQVLRRAGRAVLAVPAA